ncbi:acetolactate synthase large subunit [Microvirga sp. VF16]|uniref:acetolactate synthase large subunit n=1 Tax=Microvirga sp. VF16 TaxID=2807101 RepID=UPI00193E65A5|nr:acetolactate synthase large subunit [Microvirga sp. VF16]QRM31385.1 acetolactate synthase large subunit [Microvirga sp. VF16]QRM31411.1 acetolactate synthase large subunit [Microvirga sp. VF16]
MNGADRLCDVLLANDVDVCFANPGTSEMHFVAALDRKPRMRCVLGLFEGVVTGAADGYARMADRPAATLLHLGPGLANGLANLHNARRAHTPMINVVGDHATYHLQHDAPLTSDIESLARPMSHWVRRIADAESVGPDTAAAYQATMSLPGITTLILPADAAWGAVSERPIQRTVVPKPEPLAAEAVLAAANAVRSGRRAALMLTSRALRADALEIAGRIAEATGLRLTAQAFNGRIERGVGRVPVARVPYPIDLALEMLRDVEVLILVGAEVPVAFFAYPGKPGRLVRDDCEVIELAQLGQDLKGALAWLADELGVRPDRPAPILRSAALADPLPAGRLTADAISRVVARMMPENAIICDEAITSGRQFFALSQDSVPHDYLHITGGSIGIGIPLAAGAAIACPDRKVIGLQADGSGMYTVQGLWTQARENLDVITIVFANRAYAILQGEMRNVGVNEFGRNAQRMLTVDEPALDWLAMARGLGVEAGRASTVEEFVRLFEGALLRRGPFLIEAVL